MEDGGGGQWGNGGGTEDKKTGGKDANTFLLPSPQFFFPPSPFNILPLPSIFLFIFEGNCQTLMNVRDTKAKALTWYFL